MDGVIMSSVRFRVSAAILAGGRASRMRGADKSALVVGGARIVDRQRAALAAVADDILIVGGPQPPAAGSSIPVIPDAIADAGPIGGIYTALGAAAHPWVVVVACDMPFVTAGLFTRLVEEADADVDCVIPRSTRGLEPLCALYACTAIDYVRRLIDEGERRVGRVAEGLRCRELAPEALAALDMDGRLFENVNTPHDYARAREAVRQR